MANWVEKEAIHQGTGQRRNEVKKSLSAFETDVDGSPRIQRIHFARPQSAYVRSKRIAWTPITPKTLEEHPVSSLFAEGYEIRLTRRLDP